MAYFGLNYQLDDTQGIAAIERLLRGDNRLIETSLQALLSVIWRSDVPEVGEIIELFSNGKRHIIGLPFLAGIEEHLSRHGADSTLSDLQIGRSVAFHYVESYIPEPSNSYQKLLSRHPRTVINVLVKLAMIDLQRNHSTIQRFWKILNTLKQPKLISSASLQLLNRFPVRCPNDQLRVLDELLWVVIERSDGAYIKEIIAKKSSRKSMNLGQNIHWLTAGLIVSPSEFIQPLRTLIKGYERRVIHLMQFLRYDENFRRFFKSTLFINDRSKIVIFEFLIRIMGKYVRPNRWQASGIVTLEMDNVSRT